MFHSSCSHPLLPPIGMDESQAKVQGSTPPVLFEGFHKLFNLCAQLLDMHGVLRNNIVSTAAKCSQRMA